MSATDFLPRREADLRSWSINFNAKINADPTLYGLTVLQAADYNLKHNTFITTLALAKAPSTSGRGRTISKNEAVRILRASARQFAGIIRAHGVTDEQKSNLGLTIRKAGGRQTLIPRPRSAPSLHIISQIGSCVKFRLRDLSEPGRHGRPRGVSGATVMSYVGEVPLANIKEWTFVENTTRVVNSVTLPGEVEPGSKVWLTAYWFNPRCESGPVAQPICVYTQYGSFIFPVMGSHVMPDVVDAAA